MSQVDDIEMKVAELQETETPEEDWRRALASPGKKQFKLPRNSPWRSSTDITSPSPKSPKSPSESKPMREFQFDDTPTETQRVEPQRHTVVTRSLSLTGETPEDSIPACSAEADESLEMPSVKNLLSMFRRAESEPSQISVNRVSKCSVEPRECDHNWCTVLLVSCCSYLHFSLFCFFYNGNTILAGSDLYNIILPKFHPLSSRPAVLFCSSSHPSISLSIVTSLHLSPYYALKQLVEF